MQDTNFVEACNKIVRELEGYCQPQHFTFCSLNFSVQLCQTITVCGSDFTGWVILL